MSYSSSSPKLSIVVAGPFFFRLHLAPIRPGASRQDVLCGLVAPLGGRDTIHEMTGFEDALSPGAQPGRRGSARRAEERPAWPGAVRRDAAGRGAARGVVTRRYVQRSGRHHGSTPQAERRGSVLTGAWLQPLRAPARGLARGKRREKWWAML